MDMLFGLVKNLLLMLTKKKEKKYEEYWEKGGLQFRGVFKDIITDKKANDSASFF